MKRLSREEIKPPGLEWSFDISLILDHIQSEVKGGDQATTTQSRAHATLTAQNLLHAQYMHKMFPRHVCVCEKGETERVSETTRHTERLGDMYGPQKHNGSLTDIFHNRASVSCVQSSLTGVERCNEEET